MSRLFQTLFTSAFVLVLFASACGEVDKSDLEEWSRTEKGPNKLSELFTNPKQDLKLRAQAALYLVRLESEEVVEKGIETMGESERSEFIRVLAPLLWMDARVEGAMTMPRSLETRAKDMLFTLRHFADSESQDEIDRYLVDWFTEGYYEGRAASGVVSGAEVMRTVEFKGAPKLLSSVRQLLARPPSDQGARARLGDMTLLGLAYTGDKQALQLLASLIREDRGDESLPERAMAALYKAYVAPQGMKVAKGRHLVSIKDELVFLTQDDASSGTVVNDSFDLLTAMGMPECLPIFINMVSRPKKVEPYRWIGTQRAIRCGGAAAIVPVLEALPTSDAYSRAILDKYVWTDILKIKDKGHVAESLLIALDSASWVAQASAIEALELLSYGPAKAQSIKKIKPLSNDRRVLRGWSSDGKGKANASKSDPTLGKIAKGFLTSAS